MKAPAVLGFFMAATGPLTAAPVTFESGDAPVTLVELFTSEGCSSCPPADAWVSKLKSNTDLWRRFVPVVFHVDYWNGLGWPDRFATPAYTARQRRYAETWRSNSVYTPGFVLNGGEWRDWSRYSEPLPSPAGGGNRLTLTVGDTQAQVVFASKGSGPAARKIEIALLGTELESDVRRGENSGRKLRHDFSVLHFASGTLTPSGGKLIATVPLPEGARTAATAAAAWVTPGDGQPPVQTVGGWLQKR